MRVGMCCCLYAGNSLPAYSGISLPFAAAIKGNASGIILAHNHPSVNLSPSQSDIDLTKKLKECGRMLEIQVLDHVILTKESYFSFADEGLI